MMNFDEFKNTVLSKVREALPNCEVSECKESKNNISNLTSIVVSAPNSNVSPTLYVEHLFSAYENGEDISDIIKNTVNIFNESLSNVPKFDFENFTDYDKAKDNLFVCAVNTENNAEFLSNIPHINFLNVSLYARIVVGNNGSAVINDTIFKCYDISVEELITQAFESMKINRPFLCTSMTELFPFMNDDIMYIVTSDDKFFGSAYGFDSEVLSSVCEKIGSDSVYVLPSSIHEVLVVPQEKCDMPLDELNNLISLINENEIKPEERLSDTAYIFNNTTKELSIA